MAVKKKEYKLTFKQKVFLKEYFKTGNGTRSAMKAYDTDDPNIASAMASQNLSKLKGVVKTWMDMEGLTMKQIMGKVYDATEATKIHTSHTEPDVVVPDHPTRLKASEIASRWLGMEQPSTVTGIRAGDGKIEVVVVDYK